jgi:uncharacterized protein (DUF2252 family)
MGLTRQERVDAGRALRGTVPRSAHAEWAPPSGRAPIAVLTAQATSRVPELVPIRHGRMAGSPFAFFRGGAAIMAMDLAANAVTGLQVQATGDAHVGNFGKYASPERNLVFDINDFDETVPGPWEWDVKRLCASLQVVARQRGFSPTDGQRVVVTAARTYRERLAEYASWRMLDLWYERTEIKAVIESFPMKYRSRVERDAKRARRKDHLRAVAKLTEDVGGRRRFVEDPPLLVHIENAGYELDEVESLVDAYRASLTDDRRYMFDRFRILDVARKVVGVGSVGTRCWIVLLEGPDHPEEDLIVLQVKEAQPSVLEPYVGASALHHHGKRVVVGQRLIQAASDVFLGWADGPTYGRHYYVRQLWDFKGQGDPIVMAPSDLSHYGALCAWILARSHARTGDAVEIAAYLGNSSRFDRAIAAFSSQYAKTNEQDHAAFLDAIRDGDIEAVTGR